MSADFFIVKAPGNMDMKGSALLPDIARYQQSDARILGFDLSELSVIYSAQIGVLIGGIKAARSRGGTVVIFVNNDTIYNLLKNLNLHKTADLVQDQRAFQERLKQKASEIAHGEKSAVAEEKGPDLETRHPQAGAVKPKRQPYEKRSQGTLIMVISMLSAATIILLAAFIIFFQIYQSTTQQQQQINLLQQKKIDSLSTVIENLKGKAAVMREVTDGKGRPVERSTETGKNEK